MISTCQPIILEELKHRIADGRYREKLPAASVLADEFHVNIKTMNKVLNQLAAAGIVERRRRSGTMIRPDGGTPGNRTVEVVSSGFGKPFRHPFWCEVFEGVHETLLAAGYRMMLNHIVSDPDTHLFDIDKVQLSDAAGRIVIGPGEQWLLDWIAATRRPMVCAGDEVGAPDTPQVYFDFRKGIADAVNYLVTRRRCRDIGFVGHIASMHNPGLLQKFHAYLYALQRHRQIDPALIEGGWPHLGNGRPAVERILERKCPDALIVAFEFWIPEIRELLRERNLSILLIGCDGLPLPEVPEEYHTIRAPRYRCGQLAAELLLDSIRTCGRKKIGNHPLPAVFE